MRSPACATAAFEKGRDQERCTPSLLPSCAPSPHFPVSASQVVSCVPFLKVRFVRLDHNFDEFLVAHLRFIAEDALCFAVIRNERARAARSQEFLINLD